MVQGYGEMSSEINVIVHCAREYITSSPLALFRFFRSRRVKPSRVREVVNRSPTIIWLCNQFVEIFSLLSDGWLACALHDLLEFVMLAWRAPAEPKIARKTLNLSMM